jgi:hypothetical protein
MKVDWYPVYAHVERLELPVCDQRADHASKWMVRLQRRDDVLRAIKVGRAEDEVYIEARALAEAVVPPRFRGHTLRRCDLDTNGVEPSRDVAEGSPQDALVGGGAEVFEQQRAPHVRVMALLGEEVRPDEPVHFVFEGRAYECRHIVERGRRLSSGDL